MKQVLTLALVSAIAMTGMSQANAKSKNKDALSTQTVRYECQGNKGLAVNYGVNGYGVPNTASFYDYLNDKNIVTYLDKDNSDDVTRIFSANGYNLTTDYIDIHNLRSVGGLNIQAPSGEMLYKSCNPE